MKTVYQLSKHIFNEYCFSNKRIECVCIQTMNGNEMIALVKKEK